MKSSAILCALAALSLLQRPTGHAKPPAQGANPEGTWEGVWVKQSDPLPVTIAFSRANGAWTGKFSSMDLGVRNIPFRGVAVQGDIIAWQIVGDSTTVSMRATLSGNRMVGVYRELLNAAPNGGPVSSGTIELRRATAATAQYLTRAITLRSDGLTLTGDLLTPKGASHNPAVVLVPGSGPQLRYSMMYVADYFARHGVIALVYDKRGCGGSSGDWRSAGYEELADDACAALSFLRLQPGVDHAAVGYFGHSQGAMLAPLVAAKCPLVRFLIAADGFGGTQMEQDVARVSDSLAESEFTPADRTRAMELYKRFLTAVASGSSEQRDAFYASVKGLEGQSWYDWLAIPGPDSYWWTFYPKTALYSCLPYWRKVRVPVMLIHGEKDIVCPIHPGLDRTVAALKGNENLRVLIVKGADHTLRVPPAPGKAWPHIAPSFLEKALSWITGRGPSRVNELPLSS